jgi:hypothetical protein
VLPGWLFSEEGTITGTFLGQCTVTYHNPQQHDTFAADMQPDKIALHLADGGTITVARAVIGPPYATMIRDGLVLKIDVYF